ncbi:RNA methyltransferase, TrmH family [Catonella morbi ATCC 51271]|uniref:RNA methyltransferase, TrmH family n=1 Tax=Catonella morbi ATCC 51271 TaxID=592026 RepID=V2Y8E8_9FIRM|nr:RNA methyltransferase [Catonella morbi]ESL03951.1 RNA methyltransferase, TrmH family [Catonella morbi ATCC 51271]
MEIISSKDNKRIKYIRSLLEKGNIRKKNHQFVVEGIKLVDEALEYGKVLEVVCAESLYNELISGDLSGNRLLAENDKNITNYVKKGSSLLVVSDTVFKSMSETKTPQGILAVAEMPDYRLLDKGFLEQAYTKNGKIKLLVLEDTADPGNLGTIMRTAEAAGVTGVIMGKGTVDIFNPKVVRSTMGSIFRLPFTYVEDLKETIKELKKSGISFYATHLKGEKSYKDIKYSGRSAIIVGNEARGLSDEVADLADTYVLIPMQGKVESLNAAVAAALMMYEV